jgi:hypothetical protein
MYVWEYERIVIAAGHWLFSNKKKAEAGAVWDLSKLLGIDPEIIKFDYLDDVAQVLVGDKHCGWIMKMKVS